MKKIRKISLMGLLAALGVTAMASCGEEGTNLADQVLEKVILTQDGAKVTADFTVPKTVKYESEIYEVSWTSSDSSVLNIVENDKDTYTADVKRPFDKDTEVVLTASVEADGKKAEGTFKTSVTHIEAAKALEAAIANVGVKPSYKEKTTVELPTKSNEYKDEITFTYKLGGEYQSTKLEGNKLTLDPEIASEKVVLNVTADAGGDNKLSKDVKTNVTAELVYLTASEVLEQAVGSMVYVQGRIKSIANETYGNIYLTDDAGKEIYLYGLYKGKIEECWDENNTWLKKGTRYGDWKDEEKFAVGDYIYVYGKLDQYKENKQVANALLQDYPFLAAGQAAELPVNEMIYVYGTVKSITSDTYGNVYIKDSTDKEYYLYGLYKGKIEECWDENNTWLKKGTRYDAWKDEEKLSVGDVIVVYGKTASYKDSPQLANGLLINVLKKAPKEEKPDVPEGFTGVVTKVAFKDSDKNVRCIALVSDTKYPNPSKYVMMTVTLSDTVTVDKAHADWNAKFVVGKSVTLTGGKEEAFNGLNQYLLTSLDGVTLGEDGKAPSALDITGAVTSGKDLTANQAQMVKVTGVCVVDGNNYSIQTAEGKSILIYFDKAFFDGKASDLLVAGKEYTVSGFLNWYNKAQVTPCAAGDIVEISVQFTETGTTIDFTKHGLAKETPLQWIKFADGSLKTSVGSATTPLRYWLNGTALHIRTYKGNLFTIESTKKIAKIEFVLSSSTKAKGTLDAATGKVDVEMGETLPKKITWTGDANKVDFTVAGDQVHFDSIIITYAE